MTPRSCGHAGRSGLTLVELLVAVALMGILAVGAIAPLVLVVRRITDTETLFGGEASLRIAASSVVECAKGNLALPPKKTVALKIVRRDTLDGKADDMVIVWGTAAMRQGLPPGSTVYKVAREGISKSKTLPIGLYRWFIASKTPDDIALDTLPPDAGQLVLEGVDGFSAEVWNAQEWSRTYVGEYPVGVRVTVARKEETSRYADWLPR